MEDPKIQLPELSLTEVKYILLALQELPGKICNPIAAKIIKAKDEQVPKTEQQ